MKKSVISSDNKSKTVWNLINQLTGRRKIHSNKLSTSDNPQKLSNSFNNHFINFANILNINSVADSTTVAPSSTSYNPKTFYLFEVRANEVVDTVRKMKNKASFGHDKILIPVIKRSISIIAEPSAHIINKSFKNGAIPKSSKIAIVRPLFKRGNIEDPSNCRPISLLTSFSKIFEEILVNRFLSFFTNPDAF